MHNIFDILQNNFLYIGAKIIVKILLLFQFVTNVNFIYGGKVFQ